MCRLSFCALIALISAAASSPVARVASGAVMATAATLEDPALWADFAELGDEVLNAANEEIVGRTRMLDNELRVRDVVVIRPR